MVEMKEEPSVTRAEEMDEKFERDKHSTISENRSSEFYDCDNQNFELNPKMSFSSEILNKRIHSERNLKSMSSSFEFGNFNEYDLSKSYDLSSLNSLSYSTSENNVQVIVRARPINEMEKQKSDGSKCIQIRNKKTVCFLSNSEQPLFTYDFVAGEDTNQDELFRECGLPIVRNCVAGYNSTIFAYGQTSSGKTYTMFGNNDGLNSQTNEDRGLIPRIFECLFYQTRQESIIRSCEKIEFKFICSFVEIYNEQIFDLLDSSKSNLQIREAKNGVYIEDVTEKEVKNLNDIFLLLSQGIKIRKCGNTDMNIESSRSHAVFTCNVESKWMVNDIINTRFGRLNLVDLAGSERQKLTNAIGERLKEASNINQSLSHLGFVIKLLADVSKGKKRHIPYRDSKLTFLLQDSLGGNSKTTLIANISPSISCFHETWSTLNFAQRAKFMKNNARINENCTGNSQNLTNQIQKLKIEIDEGKQKINILETELEKMNGIKINYENIIHYKDEEIKELKKEMNNLKMNSSQYNSKMKVIPFSSQKYSAYKSYSEKLKQNLNLSSSSSDDGSRRKTIVSKNMTMNSENKIEKKLFNDDDDGNDDYANGDGKDDENNDENNDSYDEEIEMVEKDVDDGMNEEEEEEEDEEEDKEEEEEEEDWEMNTGGEYGEEEEEEEGCEERNENESIKDANSCVLEMEEKKIENITKSELENEVNINSGVKIILNENNNENNIDKNVDKTNENNNSVLNSKVLTSEEEKVNVGKVNEENINERKLHEDLEMYPSHHIQIELLKEIKLLLSKSNTLNAKLDEVISIKENEKKEKEKENENENEKKEKGKTCTGLKNLEDKLDIFEKLDKFLSRNEKETVIGNEMNAKMNELKNKMNVFENIFQAMNAKNQMEMEKEKEKEKEKEERERKKEKEKDEEEKVKKEMKNNDYYVGIQCKNSTKKDINNYDEEDVNNHVNDVQSFETKRKVEGEVKEDGINDDINYNIDDNKNECRIDIINENMNENINNNVNEKIMNDYVFIKNKNKSEENSAKNVGNEKKNVENKTKRVSVYKTKQNLKSLNKENEYSNEMNMKKENEENVSSLKKGRRILQSKINDANTSFENDNKNNSSINNHHHHSNQKGNYKNKLFVDNECELEKKNEFIQRMQLCKGPIAQYLEQNLNIPIVVLFNALKFNDHGAKKQVNQTLFSEQDNLNLADYTFPRNRAKIMKYCFAIISGSWCESRANKVEFIPLDFSNPKVNETRLEYFEKIISSNLVNQALAVTAEAFQYEKRIEKEREEERARDGMEEGEEQEQEQEREESEESEESEEEETEEEEDMEIIDLDFTPGTKKIRKNSSRLPDKATSKKLKVSGKTTVEEKSKFKMGFNQRFHFDTTKSPSLKKLFGKLP